MITRLKEILAKPDPALGYFNGELRFLLGWAQEVAGDHAAAQESWRQARSELEPFLKEQPENYALIGDLALTNVGLGDKAAAFDSVERADGRGPARERCARRFSAARVPRPRVGTDRRARPRYHGNSKTALDTIRRGRWLRACRLLPRCSGSIQCSIRSGMIRASKNSLSRKHRNNSANFSDNFGHGNCAILNAEIAVNGADRRKAAGSAPLPIPTESRWHKCLPCLAH